MIYAGIVAGGTGSRMGADVPKQFLEIGGKPIIVHTVSRFLSVEEISCVYAAVHPEWLDYSMKLIEKYFSDEPRVKIIAGGSDRNSTVFNIINKIKSENGIYDNDIILTHDAVRPFVTAEIIRKNISCLCESYACTTAVSAVDTILQSSDGHVVSNTLPRNQLYHAQTPQSFNISRLIAAYDSLSDDEKSTLTDTCSIFSVKGLSVRIVDGDAKNIKITTPSDLKIAEAFV